MDDYFSLYKIKQEQSSLIAVVANLSGIIGALVISVILDIFKQYKKAFLLLNFSGFIFQGLMTILTEVYQEYAFYFLLFFFSLSIVAILPVYTCSMDFVGELTYPVGESISGGVIMSVNQIISIFLVLFCDFLMERFPDIKYLPNAFSLLFFLISFVSLFSLDEKLLRLQKDIENNVDTAPSISKTTTLAQKVEL